MYKIKKNMKLNKYNQYNMYVKINVNKELKILRVK